MKNIISILFIIISSYLLHAEINIIPDNYIIFEKANTGYDLYIKKTPDVNSILLTESQKDPSGKMTNYGLRTPKFHPCNGNEKRILNDKILQTKYDVYFLVDSTTEKHEKLGDVFHFFLPEEVYYGYNWAREGIIEIKPGTSINLRLFSKQYADYTGEFIDQWITLKISINEEKFNPKVIDDLRKYSNLSGGKAKIKNDDDDIKKLFEEFIPDNSPIGYDADIVFIIDATISMKEEIPEFKRQYPEIKKKILKRIKNPRTAFIFYRDYGESFITKVYDFKDGFTYADYLVNRINLEGGDDIPEAMNEAIFALGSLDFKSKNRIAFLIADAPAHPEPRGKISGDDAIKIVKEKKIKINSICLPVK